MSLTKLLLYLVLELTWVILSLVVLVAQELCNSKNP
jgi:hypothetical protein